jgi:hypothetical protein
MAQRDAETHLTDARRAVMGVYCAIDDRRIAESARDFDDVPLRTALREVAGIEIPSLGSIELELDNLATAVAAEREVDASSEQSVPLLEDESPRPDDSTSSDDDAPLVPLVRFVEAVLDAGGDGADALEQALTTASRVLVADRNDDSAHERVRDALAQGQLLPDERHEQTWAALQGVGERLHPDVRGVHASGCHEVLVPHRNEFVTKIDTDFVIDRSDHAMDALAEACMPGNWSRCNDFFCSVIYAAERSLLRDGTAAPPPSSVLESWRGVFEERVLRCPEGAFPHTFLDFEWRRREAQLVVTYKLALGAEDACDLSIDQGHIMVSMLDDVIRVQTRKWLLFDDRRRPSGGQTLAMYACRLGWMDYSITQFTECARKTQRFAPIHGAPPKPLPSAQDRLLAVIDRAERELQQCGKSSVVELDEMLNKLKSEPISTDEYVGRVARLVAQHAEHHGATSINGMIDYAVASYDVVREFAANWRRTHV